jgi:hypothetical protein
MNNCSHNRPYTLLLSLYLGCTVLMTMAGPMAADVHVHQLIKLHLAWLCKIVMDSHLYETSLIRWLHFYPNVSTVMCFLWILLVLKLYHLHTCPLLIKLFSFLLFLLKHLMATCRTPLARFYNPMLSYIFRNHRN